MRRAVIWSLLVAVLLTALLWGASKDWRERRLNRAAWSGDTRTAKLLVWLGTAPDAIPHGWGGALQGAVETGNLPLLEFLLKHGADVDRPAKFGVTALYVARSGGRTEAEKFLLAHGANPDTSRINPP
jgi:ankyrin repeat protein